MLTIHIIIIVNQRSLKLMIYTPKGLMQLSRYLKNVSINNIGYHQYHWKLCQIENLENNLNTLQA